MNRTTETAAAANFVTDYGDGQWLIMYSNRRADGVSARGADQGFEPAAEAGTQTQSAILFRN
jgi:hypothetical protein